MFLNIAKKCVRFEFYIVLVYGKIKEISGLLSYLSCT